MEPLRTDTGEAADAPAAPPARTSHSVAAADVQLRCQAALRTVPGVVRAQPTLRQGLVALAGSDRREPFPLSAFRLNGLPGAWALELRLIVSLAHVPVEVVTAAEHALLGVLGAGARVRLSVVEVVAG